MSHVYETIAVCGNCLLTRGSPNWEEVFASREGSTRLAIATYSISYAKLKYWDELKKVPASTDVEIVTNVVPGEHESTYYSLLDPDALPAHFSVFLHTKNHAKLIITDSCAYVGSANFSASSQDKCECGFIIRDNNQANAMYEKLFSPIRDEAVLFIGGSRERLRLLLTHFLRRGNEASDYDEPDEWAVRTLSDCYTSLGQFSRMMTRSDKLRMVIGQFTAGAVDVVSKRTETLGDLERRIQAHDGRSAMERLADSIEEGPPLDLDQA